MANSLFQEAIRQLSFELFYKHKQISDEENEKDASIYSANLIVGSSEVMDIDKLYENLPNIDSESYHSNDFEDNDSDDNYVPNS
ncbi:hypothetical protein F8M41_018312 [Gigaspora margarita]|uniref:Uncharacterized protein n=1 Tax=Gigaspora margarita TaxID=4874 RepID=A0A8H4B2K2_GIGMA|nr:hypothetical protein F8M41_018312 [Gigaspora margarita]